MNRRNLFKFFGALPLLAITSKKEWVPLNPNPHPLSLDGTINHQRKTYRKIGWLFKDGKIHQWKDSPDNSDTWELPHKYQPNKET